CSFHQLDVHWYRNGHALSETGPALHLSCLTNDDAGDYTCSLDPSGQKTSAPWSLVVLEDEDGEDVKVRSSVTDNVVKEGGQVTLTCTSACSFHQLELPLCWPETLCTLESIWWGKTEGISHPVPSISIHVREVRFEVLAECSEVRGGYLFHCSN
ncbi:unnamed protein product, partial [Boreogadus saida]